MKQNLDRFKTRYYLLSQSPLSQNRMFYSTITENDELMFSRYDDCVSFTFNMVVSKIEEGKGVLTQCTGLKDKNGKLIYEGDIVLVQENINDEATKYIVDWSDDNAGFCLRSQEPNHPDCDIYGGFHNLESIEIIGNIYENKELLNR